MKTVRTIVALALLALATSSPARAAVRTETQDYVGSSQLTIGGTCASEGAPMNIGKACFKVKAADDQVRITLADQALEAVGFFYIQSNAAGECVGQPPDPTAACAGSGIHCNSVTVAILPGVVQLDVWVDGPVQGPISCIAFEDHGSPGFGTVGTVEARFTS